MLFIDFVMESPYVDTCPNMHQKVFILDQLVPRSVGFDSSTTADISTKGTI